MKNNKKASSYKNKIYRDSLIVFLGFALIILFIFRFAFGYFSNAKFQSRLISIAASSAAVIDADSFDKLTTKAQKNTREYRQIRSTMQKIKNANKDVLYMYTLRKTSTKNIWEFVVDASDDPYDIGDNYDITGQYTLQEAMLTPVAEGTVTSGHKGKYLSGYAPIKNDNGNTIGVLGVDISADEMLGLQSKILWGVNISLILLATALAFVLAKRSTKTVADPLASISEGIQKIDAGDYSSKIEVKTNDEFERIGNTLNSLITLIETNKSSAETEAKFTEQWKESMNKVYADIFSTLTDDKFNLINEDQLIDNSREGLLFAEVKIQYPEDIDKLRRTGERLLREHGFKPERQNQILMCISEAATNVIKHATSGTAQLRILNDRVRLTLKDSGPGIQLDRLPNIVFLKGLQAKQNAGFGFILLFKYSGKMYLHTTGEGTYLALDFSTEDQIVSDIALEQDIIRKAAQTTIKTNHEIGHTEISSD